MTLPAGRCITQEGKQSQRRRGKGASPGPCAAALLPPVPARSARAPRARDPLRTSLAGARKGVSLERASPRAASRASPFDPVPAKAVCSAQGASGGLHCYPLGITCASSARLTAPARGTLHPLAEACAAPVKRLRLAGPVPQLCTEGRAHAASRLPCPLRPLCGALSARLSSSPFAA